MKYTVKNTNHRDFGTYELGKRRGRAYFIPYPSEKALTETPVERERYSSPLVTVLSGEWDFKYYAKEAELPAELDTGALSFDKIHVPSTWQRTGYENPVYINHQYEFDDVPPELPAEMSAGVYRKLFALDSLSDKYYLNFLGVIPCINLYINGQFVGYSEGAHNTAEFDVTPYLKQGENEILAVVPKWSTGTFLECQDMFRENGIFRDVLLYALPETNINDYKLLTRNTATGWHLDATVYIEGPTEGYTVCVALDTDEGRCKWEGPAASKIEYLFDYLDIEPWNAEVPTLYNVYITLQKDGEDVQCIRNLTGFKEIQIRGEVFTFNGAAIKLKGVNHHDTHYKNGYVMSFEDYETDVKLIKALNGNCVRTSHYPPDPHLLTLADIHGLYIVDEADIETHGCGAEPHRNINLISNDEYWTPRYLDRVLRMYYRDRNHASIIMWSLGNESGGWACQDAAYDALKRLCPEIPVHYEGVRWTARHSYDVVSEMYTNHLELEQIRGGARKDPRFKGKPFYLCEYAHAMGVGPGCLEEYWEILYSDDVYMGGCIWEWADHAIWHEDGGCSDHPGTLCPPSNGGELDGLKTSENSPPPEGCPAGRGGHAKKAPRYTYGGDHGEWRHDGNFCVDGLVYPDRRLHTGALEMQAVYRPVRVRKSGDKSFTFTNTNRFRNADYLTVDWCLLLDGQEGEGGSLKLDIEPRGEREVTLDYSFRGRKEVFINFTYTDENGAFVAREQILLQAFKVTQGRRRGKAEALGMREEENALLVDFDGGSVSFDKATGYITSYLLNGKEYINQKPADASGFVPNIFRPFIDNDRPLAKDPDNPMALGWRRAGHADYSCVLREFTRFMDDDEDMPGVELGMEYDLRDGDKVAAKVELEYTIRSGGAMFITARLRMTRKKELADNMLRFGLMLEMPREFENVQYYGLGEHETLSDFTPHATVGLYETSVADMHEPYIKPQDSGNRTQVRWMKLTDGEGRGFTFCNADKPFSFSARHFSQKLLKDAKHQEDLRDENTTAVCVDGFLRPAGSASCGPDSLPQYLVDATNGLEYKFVVTPV